LFLEPGCFIVAVADVHRGVNRRNGPHGIAGSASGFLNFRSDIDLGLLAPAPDESSPANLPV
jgi:hypothetical protein